MIEEEVVAQKQIISNLLRCGIGEGDVSTQTIVEGTQVLVNALSDLEWTRINDLIAALDDEVIAQLRAGFPQLGLTPDHISAFNRAIDALENIMGRFTEMGGKPVKQISR